MSTSPKRTLTPLQYLKIERAASNRSEFFEGEMFAMTGASRKHNRISLNVARRIDEQFDGRRCEVYQSDMRVKVSSSGLYTYPDVVATCSDPQFEDEEVDTLVNPQAIFEVLSKSTEAYDRGTKFGHYRKLDSIQDYVLISQESARVERYTRRPDGQWLLWSTDEMDDTLLIASIDCQLRLVDIYARVDFDAEDQ